MQSKQHKMCEWKNGLILTPLSNSDNSSSSLLCNNAHNFNRMKTTEHERWQTQMQWQPAHWNAGVECSLIDQQCRCRLQTVIVQLLWVAAQLPTLYNTVEYPMFNFIQWKWHNLDKHSAVRALPIWPCTLRQICVLPVRYAIITDCICISRVCL